MYMGWIPCEISFIDSKYAYKLLLLSFESNLQNNNFLLVEKIYQIILKMLSKTK